ncbi:hypothetical protein [Arvimicrobium flavum]|uniref:hypothetical protein n=1 Tax=Arvimicrobium flavum TaxID=3393320 RepID=UPI00237B8199|nr:hypothetical protein [Mesorhizobium shangrilense]
MVRPEGFDTPIETIAGEIVGPWRRPRQMLHNQSYGGHATIHDEGTARALGFRSGTIEGPTHFSQFVPLCAALWGRVWHERGCISVHFREPVYDGDAVRACLALPPTGARIARIRMVNDRGATILEGDVSLAPDGGPSELERRLANLRRLPERVILRDIKVGMRSGRRLVVMPFGKTMGSLYPFTLEDKLAAITEPSPWYEPGGTSPWGHPIIPLEMASVLMKYTDETPPFCVPQQVVRLIADQEIRYVEGPLFVGQAYEIDQEVIAFSGSRRTESMWIRTSLYEAGTDRLVAVMLINEASLKETLAAADQPPA